MPQVFQPRHTLLIKLILLGSLLLVTGAFFAWRMSIRPVYSLGQPVNQPVPFSHKHHVNDDGIDCRYCHTSVEKSSFAGMPATQICMSCHSQLYRDAPALAPVFKSFAENKPILWNRIYKLPDFVYFDHSIHVNKGIGCVSCHGQIDTMPLTAQASSLQMQWCLACHRDPASHLRPHEHVFDLHWMPAQSDLALIQQLATAEEKAAARKGGRTETTYTQEPHIPSGQLPPSNADTRLYPSDELALQQRMDRTLGVANGRLTPQERQAMGRLLEQENHILSPRRLTDCSTCHR